MGPSPQKNLSFQKNGQTFSRFQLGQLLKLCNLSELRELVRVLKDREYFTPSPRVSIAGAALVFLHGYFGPIGPKTKGRRDASQRSRANRRKASR